MEGTGLEVREGSALEELKEDETSRKSFFKMMGGAGAAGAFALLLAACGDDEEESGGGTDTGAQKPTADNGDVEIVNYALTLEHLENMFYTQVLESGVVKDPAIGEAAMKIQQNEQEHVDALTATVEQLGGKPAAEPKTKFEPVIEGGPKMILATAAQVENLGAAAYLGQAGKIKSPDILAAALSIHSVEARHAAALNELAGNKFEGGDPLVGTLPNGAFAKPMTMEEVLKKVQPFLAS